GNPFEFILPASLHTLLTTENQEHKNRHANNGGHYSYRQQHTRHQAFAQHRGQRHHQTTSQRTAWQQEAVILTQQQAGNMWSDQTNKTDSANKGHRGTGQQTDTHQRRTTQTCHVATIPARLVFSHTHRGHAQRSTHWQRQQRQQHHHHRGQPDPGRTTQRAHAPEHQLPQRFLRGYKRYKGHQ